MYLLDYVSDACRSVFWLQGRDPFRDGAPYVRAVEQEFLPVALKKRAGEAWLYSVLREAEHSPSAAFIARELPEFADQMVAMDQATATLSSLLDSADIRIRNRVATDAYFSSYGSNTQQLTTWLKIANLLRAAVGTTRLIGDDSEEDEDEYEQK